MLRPLRTRLRRGTVSISRNGGSPVKPYKPIIPGSPLRSSSKAARRRPKGGQQGDMTSKPAGRSFINEVRRALYHLYDPPELRKSPLGVLFGVAEAEDVAAALRRILTETIEALKPDAD